MKPPASNKIYRAMELCYSELFLKWKYLIIIFRNFWDFLWIFSILSITMIWSISPLDIIVNERLQIINKVAIIAVAFVKKSPAVLENIKLSWETPIPGLLLRFCNNTIITNITARTTFITTNRIFSMRVN